MYVTRLLRKRRQQAEDGERGVALVAVVGVMSVLMIVSTVVLTSSSTSAGLVSSTRDDVQSSAAANAGIEAALAQMDSGNFVCTVASAANASPIYSATISYTSSTGAAITCSTTATATPASATVISTGTSDATSVSGVSDKKTTKLGATVAIQVTPGGVSLVNAIFTNGGLNLNNNDVINQSATGALDGDIYSNNAITCAAGGTVDGTIYTESSVTLSNSNCVTYGTIWSAGSVIAGSTSGVVVKGSIYAVGSIQTGTAPIAGSVIAGTSVTLGQADAACPTGGGNESVCGSVWALDGGVATDQNGSKVVGSIYAQGAIAGTNNPGQMTVGGDVVSLAGNITGYMTVAGNVTTSGTATNATVGSGKTKCAGSTCSPVLPLPTAANPGIVVPSAVISPSSSTNLGTKTTTPGTIKVAAPPIQYIPQVATGTTAWVTAGWKVYVAPSSWCSTSNGALGTDISNQEKNYSAGTNLLIDFSACSGAPGDSNVSFSMASTAVTNLALYVPHGISMSNGTTVTSTDSNVHTLYIISPSNASGVTWSGTNNATPTCSGGPNDSFNSLATSAKTQVFIYTPCTLTIQNGGTIAGQFYTGNASFPTSMILTIPTAGNLAVVPGMTIPGGTTSATASYAATITSRYVIGG